MSDLVTLHQEIFERGWSRLPLCAYQGDHPTGEKRLSKLPSSNTLKATQLLNLLARGKWGSGVLVSAPASGDSQQAAGREQADFCGRFWITR